MAICRHCPFKVELNKEIKTRVTLKVVLVGMVLQIPWAIRVRWSKKKLPEASGRAQREEEEEFSWSASWRRRRRVDRAERHGGRPVEEACLRAGRWQRQNWDHNPGRCHLQAFPDQTIMMMMEYLSLIFPYQHALSLLSLWGTITTSTILQ